MLSHLSKVPQLGVGGAVTPPPPHILQFLSPGTGETKWQKNRPGVVTLTSPVLGGRPLSPSHPLCRNDIT